MRRSHLFIDTRRDVFLASPLLPFRLLVARCLGLLLTLSLLGYEHVSRETLQYVDTAHQINDTQSLCTRTSICIAFDDSLYRQLPFVPIAQSSWQGIDTLIGVLNSQSPPQLSISFEDVEIGTDLRFDIGP